MAKPANRAYQGPLIATHANQPMERLYIDLIGPLVNSKRGNTMILIVLDDCTKYTWLFPLREGKSKTVISKLRDFIMPNYSVCRSIVSDNASIFRSYEFKNFLFKFGIEHRRLAPYRPSGNRSERYIQSVKNHLKCFYHDCQRDWDSDLGNLQLCLNTALNNSTGHNAFELMYSFTPNHGLSNVWNLNDLIDSNMTKDEIKQKLQSAIKNVKKSVELNKRGKYDESKIKHPFVVGSKVTVKTHYQSSKANKFTNRLALRFEGVYKIIYFITPVTCLIQEVGTIENVKKVHVGELKLL